MSVRTAARNFDLLLAIATPFDYASPALVEAGRIPIVCGGNRAGLFSPSLWMELTSSQSRAEAIGASRRRLIADACGASSALA
jgi:hypothetical protein